MREPTPNSSGGVTFDPDDLESIYAYLQTMEVCLLYTSPSPRD